MLLKKLVQVLRKRVKMKKRRMRKPTKSILRKPLRQVHLKLSKKMIHQKIQTAIRTKIDIEKETTIKTG